MKKYLGHLWETMEDWHPVVIRCRGNFMDDNILRPSWLNEYCPDGSSDYDAWCHPDDQLTDATHRTVYFFRDLEVATVFALTWS